MRRIHALVGGVAFALTLLAAPVFAAPNKPPRLTVVFVVDQLGTETLHRMRGRFGKGGIARLMSEGSVFAEAHYSHLSTLTAPGHACIVSGSYPYKNGIVANRYYNRALGATVTMLADPSHPILEATASPEDDTSPAAFVGETLGDRLRASTQLASKVVAIALKDRAAVLLGGRVGQAWWFSEQTGKMTTSTFYTKELPDWVKAFNQRRLADAAFGKVWDRALSASAYVGEDTPEWELDAHGHGRTFPKKIDGGLEKPGRSFYRAFAASPFAIEMQVEFVRAALAAEELGRDAHPDLLLISFNTSDLVGHLYGPDSHEAQDILVRIDRAIASLLPALEKAAGGKQNLLVALTSDHGVSPVPESMASLGQPAGRIADSKLLEAMNASLREQFGEGEWISAIEEPSIYLNEALIRARKLDPVAVQEVARRGAESVDGVQTVFTRAQLQNGLLPQNPLVRAAQLAFHPAHSGDLILIAKPFYLWGRSAGYPGGTAHGSPWRYDSHVPLVFWGGGIRAATYMERVDMADLAPTLAAILRITAPAAADGQVLPQLFR